MMIVKEVCDEIAFTIGVTIAERESPCRLIHHQFTIVTP